MKSVMKSTEDGPVLYLELSEKEVRALWLETKQNGYNVDTYELFTDHLIDFLNKVKRTKKLDRIHHNSLPEIP